MAGGKRLRPQTINVFGNMPGMEQKKRNVCDTTSSRWSYCPIGDFAVPCRESERTRQQIIAVLGANPAGSFRLEDKPVRTAQDVSPDS